MRPTTAVNEITDPSDPRLAPFRRLKDAAFRRSVEARGPFGGGMVVAEGWLPVERLLGSRHEPIAVLTSTGRTERALDLLAGRPVTVYSASPDVITAVVGFDLHRGIVAVARRARPLVVDDVIARARHVVVTEGVNDAENLGSLIRSAAALGAHALLTDPTTCDPLSRRCIRVSTGWALRLPTAAAPWPGAITTLRDQGFRVVALTPRPDAVPITELDAAVGQRTAVLVGAEGPGLSDAALDAATDRVRIPMTHGVDSLNVATAAAIAFHRLFIPQEGRGDR
ncbi:MAG TPA: RNA methyltransferase [Microthrixaceae bacterium]|jgi:tRNA G18 (ribose-2'-O)-methylase SpoU|nr:RNA methyltransferase [Microthrixaceae bacterium]HMT23497.1 RNA methyltransferase [Microthrixaceae bacterium]HMT61941.1 RNA methyltransferase [Microthrixaceae bacterium]